MCTTGSRLRSISPEGEGDGRLVCCGVLTGSLQLRKVQSGFSFTNVLVVGFHPNCRRQAISNVVLIARSASSDI
jgi:hypothetical protein